MTFPSPATGTPAATPAKKRGRDVVPDHWVRAVMVPAVLVAIMVVVQLISLFADRIVYYGGIRPRSVDGLIGVATAPFVHGSWSHLLANAVPFLIFGFLVMVNGPKQFVVVTVLIWLVAGLGVWSISPGNTVVVGASGVVFGWLAYLVSRGIFSRKASQIVLGLVLLAVWGSMFWGVFPGAPQISWQGHLFGAIGGVLAAFLAAKADGTGRSRKKPAEVTTGL